MYGTTKYGSGSGYQNNQTKLRGWCCECMAMDNHGITPANVLETWQLPSETWRDVLDWEGVYQVSNLGRVRSMKRTVENSSGVKRTLSAKMLKPKLGTDGYLFVSFYRHGVHTNFRIHRLVVQAFIGDIPNDHHAHHVNGERADNRLCNLRILDGSHHHRLHSEGERNGRAILSARDVFKIRRMIAQGRTNVEIAHEFGVSHSTISKIRRGQSWKRVPSMTMLTGGRSITRHQIAANIFAMFVQSTANKLNRRCD